MVLFNTDVNGIPNSGIALEDVHHTLFIPKPTTLDPGLPSGSLWLRPYDGAMEMLTYQGTSGILEVLNGQGYASYHTITQKALSTSVPVIIEFDIIEIQDDRFISSDLPGTDFIINANGLYRIHANLLPSNNVGGGASDGRAQGRALINGSEIAGSNCKTYFPTPSDGFWATCSFTVMISLNIGDVIQFELEVLTGGGTIMAYTNNASFELIRPETP